MPWLQRALKFFQRKLTLFGKEHEDVGPKGAVENNGGFCGKKKIKRRLVVP